jgi:iron complex outermembrane receptor protein
LYQLNNFPSLIPPQKIRGFWSLKRAGFNAHIEGIFVPKQSYYSVLWDLVAPPDSYFVLNASLGILPRSNHSDWEFKLYVENATQSNYRDYLDRFRYFVPQPARNLGIRFIYNLHHHRKHA